MLIIVIISFDDFRGLNIIIFFEIYLIKRFFEIYLDIYYINKNFIIIPKTWSSESKKWWNLKLSNIYVNVYVSSSIWQVMWTFLHRYKPTKCQVSFIKILGKVLRSITFCLKVIENFSPNTFQIDFIWTFN